MMEFQPEIYKFSSERLLTMMSIFLSSCMLTDKLPSTLMHVVIIPLLKYKSKAKADVNNYRPNLSTVSHDRSHGRVILYLVRELVADSCRSTHNFAALLQRYLEARGACQEQCDIFYEYLINTI